MSCQNSGAQNDNLIVQRLNGRDRVRRIPKANSLRFSSAFAIRSVDSNFFRFSCTLLTSGLRKNHSGANSSPLCKRLWLPFRYPNHMPHDSPCQLLLTCCSLILECTRIVGVWNSDLVLQTLGVMLKPRLRCFDDRLDVTSSTAFCLRPHYIVKGQSGE